MANRVPIPIVTKKGTMVSEKTASKEFLDAMNPEKLYRKKYSEYLIVPNYSCAPCIGV